MMAGNDNKWLKVAERAGNGLIWAEIAGNDWNREDNENDDDNDDDND